MFFVLSKTVAFLLLPSNVLFIVAFVGMVLLTTRRRGAGVRMIVASIVVLALIGYLPVGKLLLHTLENRFPPWNADGSPPAGVIVLGGAIAPELAFDRGEPTVSRAAGRIIALARLARQYPRARIIYSGGSASLFPHEPAEADAVGQALDALGIARERVVLERRSRNTAENAAFSKALAGPKPGERWLLVTSAAHMPRAIGCFRKAGFPVAAYPTDWTTLTHVGLWPTTSLSEGLSRTDEAVHEWIGLLVYWATGRTSELFPGPAATP